MLYNIHLLMTSRDKCNQILNNTACTAHWLGFSNGDGFDGWPT